MEVKMKLVVENELDLNPNTTSTVGSLLLLIVVVVRITRRFGEELQTRCHGVPLPE
jgi:hypothetical protein